MTSNGIATKPVNGSELPLLTTACCSAAGAGVTLVPGLAAGSLPPGVRLRPLAEPVTRQIFTVSRRGGDRQPAVRVVLDALLDATATIPPRGI